ncbi:cytochrome b5-like heme/steroid binding domain-containing protein [Syncephalis fuscata]|nr:cytochrome b5-like heme/steroid binding domain-containing protein [Syncephalis fuscata]
MLNELNTVSNSEDSVNESRRLTSHSSSSSLSSVYSSSSEVIDLDDITVATTTPENTTTENTINTINTTTTATSVIAASTTTRSELLPSVTSTVTTSSISTNTTTSTINSTNTGASITTQNVTKKEPFTAPPSINQSRSSLLKPSIPAPAFPSLNSPQRSAGDRLGSKPAKRLIKGVAQLGRYTLADVRQHRTESDCWCVLHGKVYNITSYIPFHPGGKRDLIAIAGKDATKLFMETHGWVNADMMLDQCLVGFLVRDH